MPLPRPTRAKARRQGGLRRQRQAAVALEQLRCAVDEHAIVSIADVKGDIVHVNDRFCAISGYRREQLLGQNHRMIKSDLHPPEFYRELWRTIGAGRIWNGEVCNRRSNGELYWVEATIVPTLDGQGRPFQYISIRTDISSLKHSEAALVEARELAERANHAKSAFLSSMSHELRTPMNAILGFSQMLEYGGGLDAEQGDNVREILKAGRHLLALINEVLDLAKIEAGRVELSLEPVELLALLEDCRSLIQPLAVARQLSLFVRAPASPVAQADRVRLKQVLLNLLSNAVKYNRVGGRIDVEARGGAAGRVRVAVSDSGAGIAAARMGELFEPFNRLDAGVSEIEGTGIGLNIARQLVEAMDGTIAVSSELGVGTTFSLDLPAGVAPCAELAGAEPAAAAAPAATAARHTVLCIDDNPVNLKLVAQMLATRRDIHLLSAHTPELGIELALAHQPDLVLLDINMPGMDGYQVLAVLRADARLRGVPIVAVTANAMPREIARGRAAGFDDYLSKPVDVAHFMRAVAACLDANGEPTT
jgi:PAS domain S-box-containing protein